MHFPWIALRTMPNIPKTPKLDPAVEAQADLLYTNYWNAITPVRPPASDPLPSWIELQKDPSKAQIVNGWRIIAKLSLQKANLTPNPFTYKAIVVKVHDGDTVTLSVDLGYDIQRHNLDVRLFGINAPELNTPAGKDAKAWLEPQILGREIIFVSIKDKQEKYGRILGQLWLNGVCINDELVRTGHALPWDGQGAKPV